MALLMSAMLLMDLKTLPLAPGDVPGDEQFHIRPLGTILVPDTLKARQLAQPNAEILLELPVSNILLMLADVTPGSHILSTRIVAPDTEGTEATNIPLPWPEGMRHRPINFEVRKTTVRFVHGGVYWFKFLLDGEPLGEIPLPIRHP